MHCSSWNGAINSTVDVASAIRHLFGHFCRYLGIAIFAPSFAEVVFNNVVFLVQIVATPPHNDHGMVHRLFRAYHLGFPAEFVVINYSLMIKLKNGGWCANLCDTRTICEVVLNHHRTIELLSKGTRLFIVGLAIRNELAFTIESSIRILILFC